MTLDLPALFEALADPERRQAAGAELLEGLRALAARAIPRASPEERQEVLQRVALVLLERVEAGRPAPEHGAAYVRRMLHNAWIDRFRRRRLARDLEDRLEEAPGAGPDGPWLLDPEEAEAGLRRQFDGLVDEAATRRQPRYREDLRRAAEQVWRLAAGDTTMEALLAEQGLEPGAPEPERKRVVDRLLQRHHRARLALEQTVDTLTSTGEASVEEAAWLRRVLAALVRCQRPSPSPVPPRVGAP